MDNPFDVNPYIVFGEQVKFLTQRSKALEAETLKFHDEFLKVFLPDQNQFDALKDDAKKAITTKKPQSEIDTIYYNMAMIYQRWLPIEEFLMEKNPLYRDLFAGLKFMLKDIEKRKDKENDAKIHTETPKTIRSRTRTNHRT